ncbi:YceH family protein [Schlegelella sp. S2-27]|uniref:YceH family protein n=1 Tax=Caldimonas mangrovi TaxID=2944811 RepID=A0ABT0YJI8_9BURK|nr:YceH family protein [Caldimonas mangrovi]MCM5678407.1 YceH family protein [Caldimonas mangrovi]
MAGVSLRPLSAAECRVLGVLVEKQLTVPDTYPLSLNALTAGCNQKTARQPVMELPEAEVQQTVDELRHLSLVNQTSGSRVSRYEHNVQRVLGIPSQSVVLLTLLMLRGPQTAAELRIHSERMHRFADVSSVDAFLDELSERDPPLVVKLPRAPGMRENRWAQLLGGPVDVASSAPVSEPAATVAPGELAALRAEVAELRALVERLYTELGVQKADT